MMHIVYSSPRYSVVEYPEQNGIELINRERGMGAFIQGDVAVAFRASMEGTIGETPTEEEVDEFIGDFEVLMKPVSLH